MAWIVIAADVAAVLGFLAGLTPCEHANRWCTAGGGRLYCADSATRRAVVLVVTRRGHEALSCSLSAPVTEAISR